MQNTDEYLNDFTSMKITMNLDDYISFCLGKQFYREVTLQEVMSVLTLLLIETKITFPIYYEYFYAIMGCLYGNNSVEWAVKYNLNLDINDIKTKESQLQLAYNGLIFVMLNVLSISLRIENENRTSENPRIIYKIF